jgi:hypothetical protein
MIIYCLIRIIRVGSYEVTINTTKITIMNSIISIRRVQNDGLQAEMIGLVERTGAVNVLAKLNIGDSRFKVGSERRAWFPVTLASLAELGFSSDELNKISSLKQDEKYTCNKQNPTLDGHSLCIQVTESNFPDVYQRQNVAKTAKQLEITPKVAANARINTKYDLSKFLGETGYFMDEEGNYIFSKTSVTIKEQLKHTFIEGDFVPESMLGEYGATLAEPTKVEVEEAVEA